MPTNPPKEYFAIRRDDRGTEYVETGDAVLIVPLTEDGDVIFIREPSAAFGNSVLTLPTGETEDGEAPADTANRELQEEIGYKAAQIDALGEVRPMPKYLKCRIFTFLARDLTSSKLMGDENYNIESLRIPLSEFETWIEKGELQDANAIAALYFARRFLETT